MRTLMIDQWIWTRQTHIFLGCVAECFRKLDAFFCGLQRNHGHRNPIRYGYESNSRKQIPWFFPMKIRICGFQVSKPRNLLSWRRPTNGMALKPNHLNVDAGGMWGMPRTGMMRWTRRQQQKLISPYANHGAGMFTYKTGWFLWFSLIFLLFIGEMTEYLGQFDHDRTLFSRALEIMVSNWGNHPLLWPQDSG